MQYNACTFIMLVIYLYNYMHVYLQYTLMSAYVCIWCLPACLVLPAPVYTPGLGCSLGLCAKNRNADHSHHSKPYMPPSFLGGRCWLLHGLLILGKRGTWNQCTCEMHPGSWKLCLLQLCPEEALWHPLWVQLEDKAMELGQTFHSEREDTWYVSRQITVSSSFVHLNQIKYFFCDVLTEGNMSK